MKGCKVITAEIYQGIESRVEKTVQLHTQQCRRVTGPRTNSSLASSQVTSQKAKGAARSRL
jgi:hypothetical protein